MKTFQQITEAATTNGWVIGSQKNFSGGHPYTQTFTKGTESLTVNYSAPGSATTAATGAGVKLVRKGLKANIVSHLQAN